MHTWEVGGWVVEEVDQVVEDLGAGWVGEDLGAGEVGLGVEDSEVVAYSKIRKHRF